jgi:hypothetical protein
MVNTALICFSAVLEHLLDPYTEMSKLCDKLPNDCLIAVEVPDIDAFDGKNGEPYGEFSLEHINYFSERSLSALFYRLGCNIIKSEKVSYQGGGSLILLAQNKHSPEKFSYSNDYINMQAYIVASENKLESCLKKLLPKITKNLLIYGAGSHTARLIPRLLSLDINNFDAIIDSNQNLWGEKLGNIPIVPINNINNFNNHDILISSFKSEKIIKDTLPPPHAAITM